jgi:hypothetical protein
MENAVMMFGALTLAAAILALLAWLGRRKDGRSSNRAA